MSKLVAVLAALLLLISVPADATKTHPRRPSRITAETLQPASPFDCDTARASRWFGSTARCLDELCRGQNVTNASVIGGDGRLRTNPCARGFDDRR
jgi:hypothetical protein